VDAKTVEGWKVPPPGPNALGMEFFDAVAERLDLEPVAGRGGRHAVFVSGVKGMRAGCESGDLRAFQPLVSKVAWRTNRKVGTVGTAGRGDLVSNRPALWKEILLQSAVAASNLFAAQLLVELGADVNLCDRDVPFLESAVRHRDHRFLELLLSSGVEARNLLGDHLLGGSVLHAAVSSGSEATAATFSCLVRHGANINTRGYRGTTALMVATRDFDDFQATAWTNTLLSYGASLELESNDGWNALDYACDAENLLCAEQLLHRGARPTRPPKLRENDVSWWYRVRPERVRRVLDLFARYDAGAPADVASQVVKESGENYVTMALRTWDWDVIDFLVSVGGHVPSNARIQSAVYRAIGQVGKSRVVGKGIKLATDGGARLDPDDPAVLILLEKYERLARGDREAWQETHEKECCQLITLLVSAGCRLDLQLAEAPDDCRPYTVKGGDGTRYIVTKGEEGGKTALFLAEKWLGSEMVVNTIVDLLERNEQQPS
jgi:ankyrin repeat protein